MKNNIYDKESHVKPSDDTGPKAAEGADLDNEELELTSQNDIFSKNTKNLNRENINISKSQTMNTDKDNIFDKLYSSIMESDDFPPMDDAPFGDDDGGFDDPMGGDELGGEEVTVTLDRELAQKLYDAIGEMLEPGDDAELEDLDNEEGDDEMGDNPFEDSVQVQAEPSNLPDSNLKSGNNSNKQNKVKASGYHGKGGKASGGKIPEQQGDPKELPDSAMKSGNNSNMGSNKVNASGYNQGDLVK
ncbi:hypothetical protein OAU81_00100 [bacterium]|nr:hypothetical protein [bacterium]